MQHTVALPLSSARRGFTGTPAGTTQASVQLDLSRFHSAVAEARLLRQQAAALREHARVLRTHARSTCGRTAVQRRMAVRRRAALLFQVARARALRSGAPVQRPQVRPPLVLRTPWRASAAILPTPAGVHMRWRGSSPRAPDNRRAA